MRALMSEAVRGQIVQMNPVVGLSRFYRKKRKDREVQRAGVYTAEELHRIEDQLARNRATIGQPGRGNERNVFSERLQVVYFTGASART